MYELVSDTCAESRDGSVVSIVPLDISVASTNRTICSVSLGIIFGLPAPVAVLGAHVLCAPAPAPMASLLPTLSDPKLVGVTEKPPMPSCE